MKTLRFALLVLFSLVMLVGVALPASAAPAANVVTCQPGSPGFNPLVDLVRALHAPAYNTATVTNNSAICAYDIGLAAYRKFDENINNQELFSFQTAVIQPGQTLNLAVALPDCKAQVDLFYGALLQSFSGSVRYGNRLLAFKHVGDVYCKLPNGKQGCTPGYWKNHLDSWAVTGYSPNQIISTVFAKATLYPSLSIKTMLDTLQGGGGPGTEGGAKILLRAATAAVLNANHNGVDFPKITAHIINPVNNALNSQDRDTMLTLATKLDNWNNGGCPLN